MTTFADLRDELLRLLHNPPDDPKAGSRSVDGVAELAAKLFKLHVQNGTPGIFQSVNQGIFPTGRQADGLKSTRHWSMVWQVLTMGMAKAAPDALPNSWEIGAPELEGQHEDGNSTGAVVSLPAGNWWLRAEHYAKVCGLLSELAGEGNNGKPANPVVPADGKSLKRPTRRRRRTSTATPLTELQRQALELYGTHNGRIGDIAVAMGIKHPTVRQHLKAAWRKLPTLAPRKTTPAGKSRQFPHDGRGQVAL